MEIKILGAGCDKCEKTYEEFSEAISASGKDIKLTKVEGLKDILKYGVMTTPVIVVNEKVISKMTGTVPSKKAVKKLVASL